jgi:hypothetical protein
MTCPKPEVLSQWADGSLNPHESLLVGRHAETCAACRAKAGELRAVGAWIRTAAQPGPSCLSADDMAAVLEGGRVPAHVRTCPRCASEFRALRQTERKATRRRQKPPAPMTAWAAAAAIFIAVGLLLVVANQQPTKTEQVAFRAPEKSPVTEPQVPPAPPTPPVVKSTPVEVPKQPATVERKPDVTPPVKPVEPPQQPEPKPIVKEDPTPEPAKPVVRPTEVVEAPKAPVALNVRAGGLSSLADGKWVKATKIEEGMALRADGRTQFDFAQARITLDSASHFSVSKEDFSLTDGGMSAEVSSGSKLVLVLEDQRLVPQTVSRVVFCAKADRIVVEEGAMKSKDGFLQEGVEHIVKKDGIKAQGRRTMAAAVRSRELPSLFKMNLTNPITLRYNVTGDIRRGAEGNYIVSVPTGGPFFFGQASYFTTGDEPMLFIAKPNIAVRFRYYMTQPGTLEFVMKNITKDEKLQQDAGAGDQAVDHRDPLRARHPREHGRQESLLRNGATFNRGVTWFVGKPGVPTEIYIDRFEILEIDR